MTDIIKNKWMYDFEVPKVEFVYEYDWREKRSNESKLPKKYRNGWK